MSGLTSMKYIFSREIDTKNLYSQEKRIQKIF